MTIPAVKCWLDIDNDGFVHAGEHLRVILHLRNESNHPIMAPFVTLQPQGHLQHGATIKLPPQLHRYKDVPKGGGTLFETKPTKQHSEQESLHVNIFNCPPTIVSPPEDLEECVDYSCMSSSQAKWFTQLL